jgi:hypothetical protein
VLLLDGTAHPASRSDFSAVSATLHPWSEIALASSEGRFRSDTFSVVDRPFGHPKGQPGLEPLSVRASL